jgi:starch phosphorylase
MMKTCMKEIGHSMSSHRMLMDYSNMFYFPALKNYRHIIKDDYAESKALADYMLKLKGAWNNMNISRVESNARPVMQRGDSLTVTAHINLAGLLPEEIQVELYYGSVSNQSRDIANARRAEMKALNQEGAEWVYQVRIECADTGQQGHTVRILPKHEALVHPYRTGLIKWA